MIIRAFQPADLVTIAVQPAQQDQRGEMTEAKGEQLAGDWAWTAEADGRVIGCAGLWHPYGETAIAWAFLSADAGRHMLHFSRLARARIAAAPWKRIEAVARPDFAAANRWLFLLGFSKLGLLRHWGPDAVDVNWWEVVR